MKKLLYLFLSILMLFSLAACNRPRRDNIDTQPIVPTNTPLPAMEPNQTPLSSGVETPTSTPLPTQSELTATLVPAQAQDTSAVDTASSELEQTLTDLEQLLNNMDTNVDVP